MISDMARVGELIPTSNKRQRSSEDLRDQVQMTSGTDSNQRLRAGNGRVFGEAERTPLHGPHNFDIEPEFDRENPRTLNLFGLSRTSHSGPSTEGSPADSILDTPPTLPEDPLNTPAFMSDFATSNTFSSEDLSFLTDASLPTSEADFDVFLASLPTMDNATMSLWTAAPSGYE